MNDNSKKKGKYRKEKRKFSIIEKIILTLLIITFLVSAGMIGWKYYTDLSASNELKDLGQEKQSIEDLQELNPDTIGWLKVPGTVIDYPVMWTPEEPEYYLRKDFEKEYSSSGSLFLSGYSDITVPADNLLIHGHSMMAGTMFRDLLEYYDKDFLEKNGTFTFETVDGEKEFKIVAVLESEIYPVDSEEFAYYNYDGLEGETLYNEYIDGIWENSMHLIGEKPQYPQQIVTLSTCSADPPYEQRVVIVGVEV